MDGISNEYYYEESRGNVNQEPEMDEMLYSGDIQCQKERRRWAKSGGEVRLWAATVSQVRDYAKSYFCY